jgi:hypothetical protein
MTPRHEKYEHMPLFSSDNTPRRQTVEFVVAMVLLWASFLCGILLGRML